NGLTKADYCSYSSPVASASCRLSRGRPRPRLGKRDARAGQPPERRRYIAERENRTLPSFLGDCRGSAANPERNRTVQGVEVFSDPGVVLFLPHNSHRFVLAVDLGTSGCKCALVAADGVVQKWAFHPVHLYVVDQVGAEQAPEDWWTAFIAAAREVLAALPELRGEIAAICCSCQGECTVPVDRNGKPLHRALLWIDMRGAEAIRRRAGNSLFSVAGYDPIRLWRWLRLTGGAPALSGKASAGHIAFIREAWPEVYEKTHKFLNALDYMNLCLTGRFVATVDSILTTWLTDNRDA